MLPPVSSKKRRESKRRRIASISSVARASFCCMLRRSTRPFRSSRMRAGTMPLTPTAAISFPESRVRSKSPRVIATTLDHHSSGSSSAQLACREISSLGRDSVASVAPSVSIRMPSVEVVPISRPRSTAIGSPHLPDEIHESLYTIAIDGIPGIPVHLEMRADDAAIADSQDIANVIDGDAGIGEDRRVLENLLHRLEIAGFGGHSGHHPGDKHHIGERREDGAPRPLRDITAADGGGKFGIDVVHELQIVSAQVM